MTDQEIDDFLTQVYASSDDDLGVDLVFECMDKLTEDFFVQKVVSCLLGFLPPHLKEEPSISPHDLNIINEILTRIDVSLPSITQLLAFLVTTKDHRKDLPGRAKLVKKLKKRLKKEKRDVKGLLGNLE